MSIEGFVWLCCLHEHKINGSQMVSSKPRSHISHQMWPNTPLEYPCIHAFGNQYFTKTKKAVIVKTISIRTANEPILNEAWIIYSFILHSFHVFWGWEHVTQLAHVGVCLIWTLLAGTDKFALKCIQRFKRIVYAPVWKFFHLPTLMLFKTCLTFLLLQKTQE